MLFGIDPTSNIWLEYGSRTVLKPSALIWSSIDR
jgi:hypothetical protein